MNNKPKVIAVAGPTASGKSALALELARIYGGEIVSCDSMQIYRRMNIGTAKPSPEETAEIPHHMIDIAEPAQEYSCADWCRAAGEAISDITARGRLPILCGGTGLYLDNLLAGNEFAEMRCDPEYRARMEELPCEELFARLLEVDPESAAATHMNNRKRVIRALEIYDATGIPKSEWDRRSRAAERPYASIVLGLNYPDRDYLCERIDARVDIMMDMGLEEEVRAIYGEELSVTASQAIGYKEFLPYFRGEISLAEVASSIKLATRQYAKRQMTWFRRNPDIRWITVERSTTFKDIVNNAQILLTDGEKCDTI